eukprot:gene14637-20672_t
MSGRTVESLLFDNLSLRALPVDPNTVNKTRQVRGACFSKLMPTPVEKPTMVAYSADALALLDLSEEQRPELLECMAGNKLFPGSETAAHCYCGHQFGYFSGQLGDGAAIYLGEIINNSNERWELQLKGAGPTPYSRQGDGRKVLRSSLREFLASEGIPTTRAGTIVTSDSRVERDPVYSGDVIMERCSIVSRIAPTFLRFGSFEICKATDADTGRGGPSHGLEPGMLHTMLQHTIRLYYPLIWSTHNGDNLVDVFQTEDPGATVKEPLEAMYLDFLKEVTRRTAHLVAAWQCVGFCHGVLNTDNMSIVGLTLDYGPYGFMDSHNPSYVCNGSDDGARYEYKSQSQVCRWNCEKLAEALNPILNDKKSKLEVVKVYDVEYESKMRRKLGLLAPDVDASADENLVEALFETMASTGADFTNTFRLLSNFPYPSESESASTDLTSATAASVADEAFFELLLKEYLTSATAASVADEAFFELLLKECADGPSLAAARRSKIPMENIQMLMMLGAKDPTGNMLRSFGTSAQGVNGDGARAVDGYRRESHIDVSASCPNLCFNILPHPKTLKQELERNQAAEVLAKMSPAEKADKDHEVWTAWLTRYRDRLGQEVRAGVDAGTRLRIMDNSNPRCILRNWVAQQAIVQAEAGDYRKLTLTDFIHCCRYILRNWIAQQAIEQAEAGDYSEVNRVLDLLKKPFEEQGDLGGDSLKCQLPDYGGPVPSKYKQLCVTCSS